MIKAKALIRKVGGGGLDAGDVLVIVGDDHIWSAREEAQIGVRWIELTVLAEPPRPRDYYSQELADLVISAPAAAGVHQLLVGDMVVATGAGPWRMPWDGTETPDYRLRRMPDGEMVKAAFDLDVQAARRFGCDVSMLAGDRLTAETWAEVEAQLIDKRAA